MSSWRADNQNVSAGRISRESAIRCKASTGADRVGRNENPLSTHKARPATASQRTSETTAHSGPPPPHPSPPPPSPAGGSALGKIPPLKNYFPKSKLWEWAISFVYSKVLFSIHNGGLCIAGFTQGITGLRCTLFAGGMTPTHPVSALSDYPLPPVQWTLPPLEYLGVSMFRAWRGLDCATIPRGTLLPILCHLTAKWHTKCHASSNVAWTIVPVLLKRHVYAAYILYVICRYFGLLSTYYLIILYSLSLRSLMQLPPA